MVNVCPMSWKTKKCDMSKQVMGKNYGQVMAKISNSII